VSQWGENIGTYSIIKKKKQERRIERGRKKKEGKISIIFSGEKWTSTVEFTGRLGART